MVNFQDIIELMAGEGFDDSELALNTNLPQELGVDSTEMVDICTKVEKSFGVRLDPDSFETIDELMYQINQQIG